jgi:hypothetical protein
MYDSEEERAANKGKGKRPGPSKKMPKLEYQPRKAHKHSIKSPMLQVTKQQRKRKSPEKKTPTKKRKRDQTDLSDEYEESDYDEYLESEEELVPVRKTQTPTKWEPAPTKKEVTKEKHVPKEKPVPKMGIVNTRSHSPIRSTASVQITATRPTGYDSGTQVFAAIIGKEEEENDDLIDVLGNSDDEDDAVMATPSPTHVPVTLAAPTRVSHSSTQTQTSTQSQSHASQPQAVASSHNVKPVVKASIPTPGSTQSTTPTTTAPTTTNAMLTRTISPKIVLTAESESPVTRSMQKQLQQPSATASQVHASSSPLAASTTANASSQSDSISKSQSLAKSTGIILSKFISSIYLIYLFRFYLHRGVLLLFLLSFIISFGGKENQF